MTTKTETAETTGEVVSGELTLPKKESGLLSELKKSDKRIAEIEKDWAELPDVNTTEGLKLARSRRAELVSMRTGGDENRKAITKPLRDLTTSVNDLWKKYVPRIEAVEKKYDAAIKEIEKAKEEAKQEKLAIEKARVEAIQSRIDSIKNAPIRATSIELIDEELALLNDTGNDLFADFEEFSDAAQIHIETAKTSLIERRAQLVKQEEEAEALEKQRQEQAAEAKRLADAQAEQDRRAEELAEQQRQIDEAKAKAAEEARAAEKARELEIQQWRESMESLIKTVEAVPGVNDGLHECAGSRGMLSAISWELAGEYANKGESAVAEAHKRLDAKEAGLVVEARKAEEKRIADEQKAIKDKNAADKAEAKRIAAMQPEVEKLRSWFESIQGHAMPDVQSDEALEFLAIHDQALDTMQAMLSSLENRKAA